MNQKQKEIETENIQKVFEECFEKASQKKINGKLKMFYLFLDGYEFGITKAQKVYKS